MRGLIGSARSVEGRTLAILLLSVLAVHAGALFLYQRSAISAADEAFASTVATRLTLAREAILRRPADQRAAEAKALSSPHFEVGWAPTRIIQPDEAANPFLWALRGRVTALEPSLSEADLAFWIKEPGVGVDF